MSIISGWMYSVRSALRTRAADRETADEIAFHLERETRKNIEAGLTEQEARRRALLRFGGVDRWRETTRDARAANVFEAIGMDARYALRSFMRNTTFATVAILTL